MLSSTSHHPYTMQRRDSLYPEDHDHHFTHFEPTYPRPRAESFHHFDIPPMPREQTWRDTELEMLKERISNMEAEMKIMRTTQQGITKAQHTAMSRLVREAVRRAYGGLDPRKISDIGEEERPMITWINPITKDTEEEPVMRWNLSKAFENDENFDETEKARNILRFKKESLPISGIAWEDVLDYDSHHKEWDSHLSSYFYQLKRGMKEKRALDAMERGDELDEEASRVSRQVLERRRHATILSKLDTVSS